jgi:hypothetical protein
MNKILVNDSNLTRGLRMNPTVQQGGTTTIQQSIYLSHNNPCGVNQLIFEKIGPMNITYFQLKEYLDAILKNPEVIEKFEQVRITGTEYIFKPIIQTQIRYLYALMLWGQEATKFLPTIEFPGYTWRLSLFDFNGVMIWDSYTPQLEIMRVIGGGNVNFTFLPLVTTFSANSPSTSTQFRNPFLRPGQNSVQLYGICNNVSVLKYLNRNNSRSNATLSSSYIVNQAALPEATMAVASLLNDPANTRTFGIPRYGFSARQNTLNTSLLGYHCAYLTNIYSVKENSTLIETVFMRLSLEENPFV